jgi:hypothetical protein
MVVAAIGGLARNGGTFCAESCLISDGAEPTIIGSDVKRPSGVTPGWPFPLRRTMKRDEDLEMVPTPYREAVSGES